MSRSLHCALAVCVLAVAAPLAAQDDDCELAERYYGLAQDSLAEFDENAAAGWLERAAQACPRFVYFLQFGEIRMQSLDDAEKAQAVDAFISAHRVAETDVERAQALYRYASLLDREGDTQHASELLEEARTLDPANRQVAELASAVAARLEASTGDETVRALGADLYKPLRVAAADDSAGGLRPYPWPPEQPSWRVRIRIDAAAEPGAAMSMVDVEELIARALEDAMYSDWALYSAPGGFVMVNRIEAITEDGAPIEQTERFTLPDANAEFSFASYVRSLFDAPPGFYRFIAFVVSDQDYEWSGETLQEGEAQRRLSGGRNRLPAEYADIEFTDRHRIEALIYEFRIGDGNAIEPIVPGRIDGRTHLRNTGLSESIAR